MPPTAPSITAHPLHQSLGAVIQGVDFTGPLARQTVTKLQDLWNEFKVLVFREAAVTDEQQIAFARHFGDLEIHPSLAHRSSANREIYRVSNVDEAGNLVPSENTGWQYLSQSWRWHTDSSFREVPSNGSILHGIEVTTRGGDTLFADLQAAYEALSPRVKAQVEKLEVIHDHAHILSLSPTLASREDKGRYDELPPVLHPLVRIHPHTGQRCLFLSPHTMTGIHGMADGPARQLLDDLTAHATEGRFVYRHRWQPHDILMWDNRCTMHSVEPFDNTRIRRVMHRVTLKGDRRPEPVAT